MDPNMDPSILEWGSSSAHLDHNRPSPADDDSMSANGGGGGGGGGGGNHSNAPSTPGGGGGGGGPQQQQKFSRSKGACQQCRAVKQRCSGAQRHPCERCQLYKLECIFSKDPPPKPDPSKAAKKSVATKQAASASADPETSQAVLQSLRTITEKLRHIEETLANQQRAAATGGAGPSYLPAGHNSVGFDYDVRIPTFESVAGEGTELRDPVTTVTSAIKGLDQIVAASSPYSNASDINSPKFNSGTASGSTGGRDGSLEPDVPDAISRGFLTVEEAQQLFDFYFQRCVHWTPPLEIHNDRNMHHVRRRSTFLFHSILAVASYFCYVPQGEVGLRKYYAIVTTLVESLAPMVVSPNPAELTVDLLMGLLICINWKPVRCGTAMQLGPAGFSQLQAGSKLNPSSGYVLGGLALRISQLLSLARRASHPTPTDKTSIQCCRLWLFINLVDSQSALAEGKNPALDPADALRVTRMFASIKSKPSDVRLAAMVELYAAVVPIVAMHHGSRRTDFRALYRANAVLDRIISYWSPLIEEAHANGDPLAYSFLCVFAPFVRVVLNSDVLRTWLIRRQAEAKGGPIDKENARHSLTSEEAHCLGFAVQAAEEMLYYLSTASRTSTAQRNHVWAKRDPSTGHRPPLQLDPDVAQRMSSAVDSVLLVIYAFPPLFLAQMRAQNILNCDLDMAPEVTNDLYSVGFPSQAMLPASKFMRLLEVTAEFYEVVSPNKDFPAIPQAQLLRSMACVSIPEGNSTALPNFQHGELYSNGASCLVPGALNNLSNGKLTSISSEMFDTSSAAAKAYEYQMQQVAGNLPPTNANLPYPFNTMVFSTEGADRLEQILQSNVPDPLEVPSLLGSYAKIDADWNAFFSAAPPTTYDSTAYNFSTHMGPNPQSLNTMSQTYPQQQQHQQQHLNGSLLGAGGGKRMGQSPDSVVSLLSSTNTANSPANFYAQQQQQAQMHQQMGQHYQQPQQQQHRQQRQYM